MGYAGELFFKSEFTNFHHTLVRKSSKQPHGFLKIYTSPLEAASPEEVDHYYIVWKERKKVRGKYVHTITRIEIDGLEIRSGAVFAVEKLWLEKGVAYKHPSLKKLKRPDDCFTALD